MKKLLLIFLLLGLGGHARAQSQPQLNAGACTQFKAADQQLNALYQQLQRLYAADATFLKAFRLSQLAWLTFRDAQLEARFPTRPNEAKQLTYGSAYAMCRCSVLAELTSARNQQLQVWVRGTEEGNVCGGSVRRK
ncbi:MAG: DUF1311 domain-containing protein [Hymenobacter sp.]|nr:DUF1311 domain-containing protein [Hymenobacter sp.]